MTSSDEARALTNRLRVMADPYKDNTLIDAADLIERLTTHDAQCEAEYIAEAPGWTDCGCRDRLTTPPTADEREALADVIQAAMNERFDIGHIADAIIASDVWRNRRQGPITDEWEYGAVYQGHNGEWFSMDGAFAIREAAEREVERYADAQIVLGRRRKADPWEPVEAAREAEKNEE